jgi:formamidopyrimidine-DNA glycosylase
MPELPDLLYIRTYLRASLLGLKILDVRLKQPVVLRNMLEGDDLHALVGRTFAAVEVHGPFLHLKLSGNISLVVNLMLAGRIQHQRPDEKPLGYACLSLLLEDGSTITFCDQQKMAKIYIAAEHRLSDIPAYDTQGVDVLSPELNPERFLDLARKNPRKQVRSFINDHRLLSSIGNAYADEILFEARIHPKTLVAKLTDDHLRTLYDAIRRVLTWATDEVNRAGQPIHVKVRDHLRVRNRRGKPCPRCGTTIRREGVRGYDVYFCPSCQPPTRKVFVDWRTVPPKDAHP